MFLKPTLLISTLLLAVGCAATSLESGASDVRIIKHTPKGCKYLGDITGNQGNAFTGQFTSNTNLETGARNKLKNAAYKKGGNVVVLLTERAARTNSSGGSGVETNVVLTGSVYKCPDEVLDNL